MKRKIMFWIEEKDFKKIDDIAKKDGRTRSGFIRHIILRSIKNEIY